MSMLMMSSSDWSLQRPVRRSIRSFGEDFGDVHARGSASSAGGSGRRGASGTTCRSTSAPRCRPARGRRCGRRPIMHETASSDTANRPPKPQHSSGRVSSVSSMPSSDASSCRGLLNAGPTSSLSDAVRSSRRPWQLWCRPTRCGKRPVEPVDLQHVGQELAQLERLVGDRVELRRVAEDLLVVVPHHRHATAGRRDDVIVRREDPQKPLGQRPGVVVQPGVGHRLAAAGLLLREIRPARRTAPAPRPSPGRPADRTGRCSRE